MQRALRAVKPSRFGQPLPSSHPHLFSAPDELTPGIPAHEYAARRAALARALPDDALVLACAAPQKFMSQKIFYSYRQASDLWYLSGFQEPNSALLLQNKPSSPKGYLSWLFSSGTDLSKQKWDGANTPHADISTTFTFDYALPISSLPSTLSALLPSSQNVYTDSLPQPLVPSHKCRPLAPVLAPLRAIKSSSEQKIMHAAANISARAHAKTMRFAQPGLVESALAAHFEYTCALQGAQRPAYVPVVASGANALTIHYTANNHVIHPEELILLDAGCEYNGYASDITRTFPTFSFTPAQSTLYAAVLSAQKQLISLCTAASGHSLHSLHRESCILLEREARAGGIALGSWGQGRKKMTGMASGVRLIDEVYPHFLTHPIGIDLHESTYFDRNASLEPGMVITVEPGLYIPPSTSYPREFWNIGVRIEDEVLVGETQPFVLSANAPKEIADVEGACQGLLGLEPY